MCVCIHDVWHGHILHTEYFSIVSKDTGVRTHDTWHVHISHKQCISFLSYSNPSQHAHTYAEVVVSFILTFLLNAEVDVFAHKNFTCENDLMNLLSMPRLSFPFDLCADVQCKRTISAPSLDITGQLHTPVGTFVIFSCECSLCRISILFLTYRQDNMFGSYKHTRAAFQSNISVSPHTHVFFPTCNSCTSSTFCSSDNYTCIYFAWEATHLIFACIGEAEGFLSDYLDSCMAMCPLHVPKYTQTSACRVREKERICLTSSLVWDYMSTSMVTAVMSLKSPEYLFPRNMCAWGMKVRKGKFDKFSDKCPIPCTYPPTCFGVPEPGLPGFQITNPFHSLNCFRSTMERRNSESSDTISLNGNLFDLAMGRDLDGLTDNELKEEVDLLSDEDDGINVTIKEIVKPSHSVAQTPLAVASVLVVPEATKKSLANLIPGKHRQPVVDSKPTHESGSTNKRNRAGSVKRRSKNERAIGGPSSLVSMLSKVTVSGDGKAKVSSTPKRNRSPGEALIVNQQQPIKIPKTAIAPTQPPSTAARGGARVTASEANRIGATTIAQGSSEPNQRQETYSEVTAKTLDLKVVLSDRAPAGRDLIGVKKFLSDKIEDSVSNKSFLPIFKKCYVGKDGVYAFCSDFACAQWLVNVIKLGVPGIDSKLAVIPHDVPVKLAEVKDMVRVVVTLPSRKTNEFILTAFAGYNKDLNTEDWRIRKRRNKGASKTTLFMRMDRASFEQLTKRNGEINWILGTVRVVIEKRRSKPSNGSVSPVGNQPAVLGNPVPSKRPKSKPSPYTGVMEVDQVVPGLTLEEGSGTLGKC